MQAVRVYEAEERDSLKEDGDSIEAKGENSDE